MTAKCQLIIVNKDVFTGDSILLVYGGKKEILVTIWKHIQQLFNFEETKFVRVEPKILEILS